MTSQDLVNIISIAISTILSVGAIILSVWFYKESNKQNKETSLLQVEIKNAIQKLEHLYDKTYTDTFGALRNQMDAMQKHIFNSSVGNTNSTEPDSLRFYVLGCLSEKESLTIDELYNQISEHPQAEITKVIYNFHRDGVISFDGKNITYLKKIDMKSNSEGQISK